MSPFAACASAWSHPSRFIPLESPPSTAMNLFFLIVASQENKLKKECSMISHENIL
ncbi:hypothetical protein KR50_00010 [Jeotgalibacillus campisalis]|uniref:Uncharacterized protein n=1 Tax=Jeotgalibacillus campisalis TaxID=220754 RepID=A0A0C2VUT2_9BACL|nr:hypothetical protein KR50_00010 [Jeotgalibacillus campisalis]